MLSLVPQSCILQVSGYHFCNFFCFVNAQYSLPSWSSYLSTPWLTSKHQQKLSLSTRQNSLEKPGTSLSSLLAPQVQESLSLLQVKLKNTHLFSEMLQVLFLHKQNLWYECYGFESQRSQLSQNDWQQLLALGAALALLAVFSSLAGSCRVSCWVSCSSVTLMLQNQFI